MNLILLFYNSLILKHRGVSPLDCFFLFLSFVFLPAHRTVGSETPFKLLVREGGIGPFFGKCYICPGWSHLVRVLGGES